MSTKQGSKGKMGGARPGAGKPPGPHNKTKEQLLFLDLLRQRIQQDFDPILDGLVMQAKGVVHLMAQDAKTGQWTQVTDPAMMQAVMNGPQRFWKIAARNPDINAIKVCFERMWGQPSQPLEVSGPDGTALDLSGKSTAELLAMVDVLKKQLKGAK